MMTYSFLQWISLAQLEYFLPSLLKFCVLLQILNTHRVDRLGPDLFRGFDLGMGRGPAALGIDLLPLFRRRPTVEQPSSVGMRRILHHRNRDDAGGSFSEHVIDRRAFLFPGRIVM